MSNERAKQALGVVSAAPQEEDRPTTVSQLMERYKPQIVAALPRHMTAERMMRIVLTELRKVPKLGRAEPRSLFGAVVQCAQLGLEPGGALGHAYLLPFENRGKGIVEVQLIIGYRGMIELARRSNQVSKIWARIVYNGEPFELQGGTADDIYHRPAIDADPDFKSIRGAYAVCLYKDGSKSWEWMNRAQIEAIRERSKSKDSGPWLTHYDEMCRKTSVRRLWKYLPTSIELSGAVARVTELDNAIDEGDSQNLSDVLEQPNQFLEADQPAFDSEPQKEEAPTE